MSRGEKWRSPNEDNCIRISKADMLDGEYVSRKYVAEKLGIGPWAVLRAQRKGIFPTERFKACTTQGDALFTAKEADAIITGYRKWKKGKLKRSELRKYIDEHSREEPERARNLFGE